MQLIGHEGILRELRSLALSDEPPHALLLAGPDGTGRALLAIYYAQVLNCERRPGDQPGGLSLFGEDAAPAAAPELPCGECRSCRLIESGSHPDVVHLGPGDTLCRPRGDSSHAAHPNSRDIRICQVRGLIELAARYPFEARYRLIIVDPADRLAREASHTILKTLEEPPGHTIFALLTAAPEALIETIISRCRRIDVRPVPRGDIEAGLLVREVEPALAANAATASHGRPGRALTFVEHPDLMGDRDRLLERCGRIAAAALVERFKYAEELAERFRKDRAATNNELDVWEVYWEEQLRLAAKDGPDGEEDVRAALDSLRAVGQCREDLLANVQSRPAFELMLLTFPRRRLDVTTHEEAATHG